MKRIIMTSIVTFTVLALLSATYAYGGGRGHECRDYYSDDASAFAGMNFTPEQAARFRALREAHLREVDPLRDRITSKRGDLRRLWLEENPDEDRIRAAQQEIGELRARLDDRRSAYREGARSIMTEEQWRQFRSRYPSWRHNMGRMPRGGGRQYRSFHGREGERRGMHREMRGKAGTRIHR